MTNAGLLTVGVDIGGTKVAAGAWRDGRLGTLVAEPTATEGSAQLVDQVARLVAAAAGSVSPQAVGVSVAGEVDYAAGVVVNASHIPVAGAPIRATLAATLGIPVALDNDGNCAAIAEAHAFGGQKIEELVMLTLGTGVGGGVVAGGHLLHGRSGLGAELGHMVLAADGPACFGACPGRGCLEAFCSGTALARDAMERAQREPEGRLAAILRRTNTLRAEDVVGCARAGDVDALALVSSFGVWLGVALSSFINIFQPQVIAIGGGLSDACDLFLPIAQKEAARRTAPTQRTGVEIRSASAGGRTAGVIGAALLAVEEFEAARERSWNADCACVS